MEIIPLIKIRNKKILYRDLEDLIDKSKNFTEDKTIFILDYDGIEKNKPNLCTYQKLSRYYDLWVDFAPKDTGDIVDCFMSGAKAAVVRKKYFKLVNAKEIKEISENKIFLNIEDKSDNPMYNHEGFDGYIVLRSREEIDDDFKYQSNIKNICKNLYVYENNPDNISYWKKDEIKGLLVDFDKYERFK